MNATIHDLGHQKAGTVVVVGLRGTEANVRLLNRSNLVAYRSDRRHFSSGGRANRSPVRLRVPHAGHWHVAVDLGGSDGRVESWIEGIFQMAA